MTFTTNLGKFGNGTNTQTESLNSVGQAAVALRSTTPGTATVTATSNGVSAQTTVTIGQSSSGLSLSVSKTSVKSDNSDSSTITATVLDTSNAGVSGVEVTFSADGGQISATSATTDANGRAGITFSSGTTNPANQTVTITAKSGSDTKTIPVQIVGSTVTLSTDKTTVTTNGSTTAILTITAKNAGGTGVYNSNITLSVTGTGGASATVTPASGTSDVNGQMTVTVTGSSAGTVTVTVTALGATATQDYTVSAVGAEFAILLPSTDPFAATVRNASTVATAGNNTTVAFVNSNPDTITRSDGGSFVASGFTAGDVIMVGGSTSNDGKYTLAGVTATTLTLVGADSLTAEAAGASVTITNGVLVRVRAFTQTNVIFSTSMGVWDGGASAVTTKAPVSGYVWGVLTSVDAGSATVQASDKDNTATTDRTTVAFSAPSGDAARITLQASTYVVARSSTTAKNTATLTALVTSAEGQVVGSAPVVFSIGNTTGGGETVSPVLALTDSSGVATATFTSGSLSTGAGGVEITAKVLDEGETVANTTISFQDNYPAPCTITRADAGSFATDGFESGEQIRVTGSAANDGYYFIDGVAALILTLKSAERLNAESAGNTVTITAVTSSINIVIGGSAGSVVVGAGSQPEELNDAIYRLSMSVLVADSNGNAVPGAVVSLSAWPENYSCGVWYDRDAYWSTVPDYVTYVAGTFDNEDINENMILDPGEDTNADGALTPANSAAGNVPTTVTTDENGVKQFYLIYLKSSAEWIKTRIRASTGVLGTEITTSYAFQLPPMRDSVTQEVEDKLPDSPYLTYLVTDTTTPKDLTFPPLGVNTTDEPDTFSTSTLTAGTSDVTNVAGNPHKYTYTPTGGTPAEVGDVVNDMITGIAEVYDWSSTSSNFIRVEFPVRITVKYGGVVGSVIALTATPSNVMADGAATSTIEASVTNSQGQAVADGTVVSFTRTLGTLSAATATTVSGVATVTLTSGTTAGTSTVNASTADGATDSVNVSFTVVGSVTVAAAPATIVADAASTSTISATVKYTTGNLVADGTTVTFSATTGTLSAVTTTVNGVATATLTSTTNRGVSTVRADSGGQFGTVTVTFIAGAPETVTVKANPNAIPFDGEETSTITAEVVDANNNPVEDGTWVNFSVTSGILSTMWVQTENGLATVTYTAPGPNPAPASDTVTATTTNEKTGSVTINKTVETPTVETGATAATAATTASSGGNVTSDGGATVSARGVCYDTSPNPTIADNITSDGTGTGTFSSNIAGLTTGTTYYLRAYATNSAGTGYGAQATFTTP